MNYFLNQFGEEFIDVSNDSWMTILGTNGVRNFLREDRHNGDDIHLNIAAQDYIGLKSEQRLYVIGQNIKYLHFFLFSVII